MRLRTVAALPLVLLGLAAACEEAPAPQVPPPPAPVATAAAAAAPTARAPFDPITEGVTADGVKKICDEHLAAAQAIVDRIKRLKGAPADEIGYDKTLGAFDDVAFEVSNASQFPYLMAVAHPDEAVREAAKLCEPKTEKFTTALYLDPDLAAVVRAYAAKKEPLTGERKRLLEDTLRDFRRNGLELPAAKQTILRAENEQITKIGQKFDANIAASSGKIRIKPAQMAGLPADYIAKHPVKDGFVEITTDYPDYYPFVTYAKDRKAALDLYVLFTNRGGDDNVKLLGELLRLRDEKAKLLGYASWADYAIEPRMAKSEKTVRDFLGHVAASLKAPAKVELAELVKESKTAGHAPLVNGKMVPSDRYYLSDRVRAKKYAFDSKELANYFEIGAVKKGLLDITAEMYGLTYKRVAAPAWHADVEGYDVLDHGKRIGRFYLDLHPRPNKYKHAAMFPIVSGKRHPDGSYEVPVAALECNFPKPGLDGGSRPQTPGAEPALMTHDEVVVFFHEFGHVLHHLLTTSELATYSGTNTVRDFVEAPSQMFEEWAWSRPALDRFARHNKTGAKIPEAMFTSMTKARAFGRALETQRQIFLAMLDLEYHAKPPPPDTTRVVEDVQNATDSFAYVKGTHFQSSFGHLIGYDAGYYSYQWALSLSRDVLTRFQKEGLLNPATAKAWRDDVLAKGGGTDERAMVAKFLGRAPGPDAYMAYLTEKQ